MSTFGSLRRSSVRFDFFRIDLSSGELFRSGVRVPIQEKPLQVLRLLLEAEGKVVTREQLRSALWPEDTFVDFEHGVNTAGKKLRQALEDSAESPKFVETLPKVGYRFIVPVEWVADASGKSPLLRVVPIAPPGPIPLETKVQEVLGGSLRTKRTHWALVLLSIVAQVSIHGGEAVPIALQIRQPMVLDASQDGTELLIGNEEGNGFSLWVQPVAGGSPERVGTDLAHDAGFGPGAASVIYGSKKDVYSTNRDGSSSRKLLTAGHAAFAFQYSPDARVFRFSIFNLQVDEMSIMESTAEGSKFQKMFQGCCGRWTSDGRYYVFQNRHNGKLDLWALPEEKRFRWWKAENEPIQLTAGPMDFQYPEPGKDNRQIFAIGTVRRAELVRYDQHSGQFLPYLSGISAEGLASSRDGQWVAYTSFPEGTLWRSKVDGTERRQLTFPPLRVFWPRWSPDGQQIAFSADLPGVARNVYLISSEGGTPKRVLASEQSQANASWSPDGNLLLFGTLFVPKAPIYTLDLRSQSVSAVAGSDGLFGPQWSPDGKFILATTGVPGKLMLYDVSAQKWTEAFGSQVVYPTWSRDGKYMT